MTTVNWGFGPAKLTWLAASADIDLNNVTSVHGYLLHNNQLAIVQNKRKGFEIPGGHVEKGETLEASLRREALEEACVTIEKPKLLGFVEVNNSKNPEFPDDSPYPKVGYLAFFCADIRELLPFSAEFETSHRQFIEPSSLPKAHHAWNSVFQQSLENLSQQVNIGD
ncbi:NUDIX hydrolase [Veronia nyctiphanis]|nr:NUDIX domain-containing protein [Veronia nyctiphanis]